MTPGAAAEPDLARLLGPEARRSPDMEAVWASVSAEDAGLPDWLDLPPAEARRMVDGSMARWNAELPPVAAVDDLTVPGAPPVRCRLVTPPDPEPGCVLFLHGGGWSFGSPDTYARLARLLALATRRRLLVPAYRLAPEHPFPAPYDDARAAWAWLAGPGRDLAGGGPLAVAGDSAGANMALALTAALGADGHPAPAAALLFYGAYAATTDTPSYARFAEGYGLTRAAMARFWEFYAPPGTDRADPRLSPLGIDAAVLRRLPPLFLNAAGLDPLLCDTLALAERLRAAGAAHALAVHEGLHHGFMQMSLRLPEARRAIDAAAAFLRAR